MRKIMFIGRSEAGKTTLSQAMKGDTITYTLHVVNDGTVDLENLTITDESNALGILVPVISEDYGYENGVFTIAHLAVGESVDIQYRYTVVQNDPNIIENVATVHVPEGETGTDTDEPFDVPSNPVEVEVIKDGLTVEKKAAETVVKVGEDIHYTIIVTNTGNTTLHNIVVNDTTSGAGNLVNTSDASITYDAENRTWTYPGELLEGESIAITYTYTTVAADEAAGVVENTAVATGNNPGGNTVPSNPSDEDVTVFETPEAILDVVKSVDKKTAMVGDVLNYTLHVTNTGNATAYNAVVKDFFDGVGEPVKTNGDGYTVMADGNFLIAELAAGESLDITYTYTVQAEDKGVISNIVVVVPEEPPIDIEKEADKTVAAVDEIKNEDWMLNCRIWMYRGAWAEWEMDHIEMAVPISPEELRHKRNAILKHQSQAESAPYLGDDERLFWQRAEDRNRATAELYHQLGLASYEAMEAFVQYIPVR